MLTARAVIERGHQSPLPRDDRRFAPLLEGPVGGMLADFDTALEEWVCGPKPAITLTSTTTAPTVAPPAEQEKDSDRAQLKGRPSRETVHPIKCYVHLLIRHTLEYQRERVITELRGVQYNADFEIEQLWSRIALLKTLADRSAPSDETVLSEVCDRVPKAMGAVLLANLGDVLTPGGPNFAFMAEKVQNAARAAAFEARKDAKAINQVSLAAVALADDAESELETFTQKIAALQLENSKLRKQAQQRGQQGGQQGGRGQTEAPAMSEAEAMATARRIVSQNLCSNCMASGHRSKKKLPTSPES